MNRFFYLQIGLIGIALASGACRPRSSGASEVAQSSDSNRQQNLPLTKLGKFSGNTSFDGNGEQCQVEVHDKKGSDWSFLGFGGIKSLTISMSKNLLVTGKIEVPCYNGVDSIPWCHTKAGEHYVYVSYTASKDKRPHIAISEMNADGMDESIIKECWHLTKLQ